MSILFRNKKLVIPLLFVVSLMINLKGSVEAQNMQLETIVKENYCFDIESDSEVIKQLIDGGDIPCGWRERRQTLTITDDFRMTIEDKHLKEISTAFGLEIDMGINPLIELGGLKGQEPFHTLRG